MTEDSSLRTASLFPEEIVECRSRIQTPARNRPSGIMSFPLNGSPGHKKVTFVPNVFLCNAFRDGLRAFELGAGIKITAILACPHISAAFGTSAVGTNLDGGRDDSPAQGAAQNFLKPRHLHGPRPIALLAFRGTRLRLSRGTHHAVAAVVLISTLSVFSFGHSER